MWVTCYANYVSLQLLPFSTRAKDRKEITNIVNDDDTSAGSTHVQSEIPNRTMLCIKHLQFHINSVLLSSYKYVKHINIPLDLLSYLPLHTQTHTERLTNMSNSNEHKRRICTNTFYLFTSGDSIYSSPTSPLSNSHRNARKSNTSRLCRAHPGMDS